MSIKNKFGVHKIMTMLKYIGLRKINLYNQPQKSMKEKVMWQNCHSFILYEVLKYNET